MAKNSRILSGKATKPKSGTAPAKTKGGAKASKPTSRSKTAPKTAPKAAFVKRSTKAAAPPVKKAVTRPASPKSPAKKAALTRLKKPLEKVEAAVLKSETAARPPLAEAGGSKASDLVAQVVVGIREKKGYDIAVLNLTAISNRVTDYFVICTGGTDRQTQAIADSVEETLRKQLSERPWRTEGAQRGEWILMDYVNVVVHIMQPQSREFYMLEELWGDAQIQRYAN